MTTDPAASELALRLDYLEEALADAERLLAADDRGWSRLSEDNGALTGEGLRGVRRVARDAAIRDPLISRGVGLHAVYVWGEGVDISVSPSDDETRELSDFIASFLESQLTTWSGAQAREELERTLATDGNSFYALPTSPLTGQVQVRAIPVDEITDIITDPQDSATPWLYRRRWTEQAVTAAGRVTQTSTRSREALYPDVGWRPPTRPRSVDGIEVRWDTPIAHIAVNRSGSRWGVPDVLAALPWARGYQTFLGDWAGLTRSLSRIAFQATARTRKGGSAVRDAVQMAGPAGQTAVASEGVRLEAVGKSGATLDANSGRPLAAMVAAALDVPVTMLLADPGVTGARATAETLDRPMELTFQMRRSVHAQLIRSILTYAIKAAIRAPRGPLRGSITRDPATGVEKIALAGVESWAIVVDWPDLAHEPLSTVMEGVTAAYSAGLIPPMVAARTVMVTLGVDDLEGALDELTDDAGQYIDPHLRAADTAALAARRALDAGAPPDARP